MVETVKAGRHRLLRWPPWGSKGPVVPVIRLSGVIGGGSLSRGGLNLFEVNASLERAFGIKGARAVAIAINSPGGSPVQSSLIAERIRTLSAEKMLPVITFVEDVGASGGYWLALAGDEIFADANSLIGSIGVIHRSFGFDEAIKRLGIERRVFAAGQEKSMLDPFLPKDEEDLARLDMMLKDIHQSFKAMVRNRRGGQLKADDEELFEGQVWTGQRALELGLIDGIGSMHSVLRQRFGNELKLVPVFRPKPWWRRRVGLDSQGLGHGFGPREWVDSMIDSVLERAIWARYGL